MSSIQCKELESYGYVMYTNDAKSVFDDITNLVQNWIDDGYFIVEKNEKYMRVFTGSKQDLENVESDRQFYRNFKIPMRNDSFDNYILRITHFKTEKGDAVLFEGHKSCLIHKIISKSE